MVRFCISFLLRARTEPRSRGGTNGEVSTQASLGPDSAANIETNLAELERRIFEISETEQQRGREADERAIALAARRAAVEEKLDAAYAEIDRIVLYGG